MFRIFLTYFFWAYILTNVEPTTRFQKTKIGEKNDDKIWQLFSSLDYIDGRHVVENVTITHVDDRQKIIYTIMSTGNIIITKNSFAFGEDTL